MDEALVAQVRELRAQGRPPKAIARALGLRPAEVAHLVRAVAAEADANLDRELVGCWVSPHWSSSVELERPAEWPDLESPKHDGGLPPVLVAVLVARREPRHKVSACGYLVDTGCLGVKNAIGPRRMDEHGLSDFVRVFFRAYEEPPLPAPLELAQHLVLGAVEYARGLGFEPHPDFGPARDHLGDWTGPSAITFGRGGRPYYIEGPYDSASKVMRTLDRTVGRGNYEFLVGLGAPTG